MKKFNSPMVVIAQLDEAGLTASEFRVLAHICRRSGDHSNGRKCDAGISSISGFCRLNEDTVRKSIRTLIAKGWVTESRRPGQTAILTPQIPAKTITGVEDFDEPCPPPQIGGVNNQKPLPSNRGGKQLETPPLKSGGSEIDPSPDLGGHPSPALGGHPPQTKGDEGIPQGIPEGNHIPTTPKNSPTPEGKKFAEWFRETLPKNIRLTDNWLNQFANAYDDMIRLDKRTKREIFEVSQWARNDEFWSVNFMSPAKLRKRKDGVLYFDLFQARMNQPAKPNGHTKTTTAASYGI